MRIFRDIELNLDKEEILRSPPFSKWAGGRTTGEKIEGLMDKWIGELESRLSPRATINIVKRNEVEIEKYSPPDPLLESDFLVFGVVTIGEGIERAEIESDLEKLIIDGLENVALSQATEGVVENAIGEFVDGNLNTTRLIAPGSGRIDWDIENQELIEENLDPAEIGVQFDSNFSLRPPKTLSFLIGLGENIEQARDFYSCGGCERTNCPYRVN